MKQLLKNLGLGLLGGALAYALLAGGSGLLGSTGGKATGPTHYSKEAFYAGLFGGASNKFEVGTDGELSLNGLVTIVSAGSFADATTTLFAVRNPWGALATASNSGTSTADLVRIDITTIATSSARLTVATSSVAQFAPPATAGLGTTTAFFNKALLSAAGTATSTLYSGIPTTAFAANSDSSQFPSADRLLFGPNAYLVGWLTADGPAEDLTGYTNPLNRFTGTYKIRWVK